jgi:uncharacterized phage protein gp47/JayE
MRKTKTEMLNTVLTSLVDRKGITDVSPGSVARMFTEVLVEEFYQFYEQLDAMMLMTFVSTARGTYLDLIGSLLACTRNVGETDNDYRYRITNQVYVVQGANLTSLRVKVLQVSGVADVEFKRFSNGAGSFTCYVIPETYPISNDVINKVQAEVDATAAYGIYGEVKISTAIPVDFSIQLVFTNQTTNAERQTIRQQAVASVERYTKELLMGSPIIINEVIQRTMDVSAKIMDIQIVSLTVNEVNQYVRNLYPKTEEQYFLRRISVT